VTRLPAPRAERSYERVAWCYDAIARVYSRGRIARVKAWQSALVRPGERILYPGIGAGDDALMAAARGARVTGIDVAPAMLRRAAARFEAAKLDADLCGADLFGQAPAGRYDAVALNFFLNVFAPATMEQALLHAVSLLAPGGRVLIADFAPLQPRGLARLWGALYYWPVNLTGALFGLAGLHAPYDYAPILQRAGFTVRQRRGFPLFAGGPAAYEVLIADGP
jgi:demethylmenaquinone methyltransferase/2-methoxy-6-polyprenyl-1,4-benzoquinol methylase